VIIDIDNRSAFEIEVTKVKKITSFIMQQLNLSSDHEVSVSFANEDEMTQLHEQWMQEPGPTDVMSFALGGITPQDKNLGDVVICPQVALRDAIKDSKPPAFHLTFLLVHGLLHLNGWDHQKTIAKFKMQRKEAQLMTAIDGEFKS
jgi:probable rRNA maturation factor